MKARMMTASEILSKMRRGVNWGPKPLEHVWTSPSGRFVLIRRPGYTGWKCRGEQKYYATEHVLLDAKKADGLHDRDCGMRFYTEVKVAEYAGRLTKEMMAKIEAEVSELEKSTKAR